MIRIDRGFHMFDDTHIVKIATDLKITPEYLQLTQNNINLSGNNLRILIIGDSYIAGAGINPADRFSQQLKNILKAENKKYDSLYVLDVSKPNSNTLDNNQSYFHFVNSFQPHVVILGYNINDVNGNLDKANEKVNVNILALINSDKNISFAKKLFNIYKTSMLLDFILHRLHTEMKTRGVIFPNSEFDLILKAYSLNRPQWKKSKLLLQEMTDDAAKRNSHFIVLKFPEINLLEYPSLFTKADAVIRDFFVAIRGVTYIDAGEILKANSRQYMLSKYDGHPNERAHKEMAAAIAQYIDVSAPRN